MSTLNEKEIELDDKIASQMLDNIFRACSVTPNAIPFGALKSWGNYKRADFRLCKIISGFLLALLLVIPFFFIPSRLHMTDLPRADGNGVTLDFKFESLLPVMQIDAALNGRRLSVVPVKYNHYTVDVTENGDLDVTITLLNGRSTQYDLTVDSVVHDTDAPEITGSSLEGELLTVYVTDSASAVDFDSAYALDQSGEKILPLSVDRAAGALVFPYSHADLNLYVSDTRGNEMHAIVTSRRGKAQAE